MNSTSLSALSVLGFHAAGKSVSETRADLLAAGVLKGTVSKVCKVLRGLQDGRLTPEQVTSLNQAYYRLTYSNPDFRAICTATRRLSDDDLVRLEQHIIKLKGRRNL